MAKVKVNLYYQSEKIASHSILCPACKVNHDFDKRWTFNNNFLTPTFSPSMLHKPRLANGEFTGTICHSFVTDGNIWFLNDCTHDLAGQTVELPELEKVDE